jgi:CRP-like cAMP-binding protein
MASKEMATFLSQSATFAGLPAHEIEALASVAQEERHRSRSYIFMEGDPSRWFYLVKSGHVKILRNSKTGKDVVLELLGPGEVFGGVAVIEKRPYPPRRPRSPPRSSRFPPIPCSRSPIGIQASSRRWRS